MVIAGRTNPRMMERGMVLTEGVEIRNAEGLVEFALGEVERWRIR